MKRQLMRLKQLLLLEEGGLTSSVAIIAINCSIPGAEKCA